MSQQVDVKIIQPFIEATVTTLKVQCKIEVQQKKPYLKDSQPLPKTDIAGIIGITSEGFNGSISLCFPEATFLSVMSAMLGEEYKTLTKDLEDGAGELVNIIFGLGKRTLNQNGFQLQKALPSVVVGSGINLRQLTPAPTIVIPFDTSGGAFHVEITTESIAKAS